MEMQRSRKLNIWGSMSVPWLKNFLITLSKCWFIPSFSFLPKLKQFVLSDSYIHNSSIQEVSWQGSNIVVMNEVKICPPYFSNNCYGPAGSQALHLVQSLVGV